MIELKNVSKTYENGTKALKDVTLSIKQGEFVFVVGASGAGKSTFLKLILREEVPTSGKISVNGYDLVTIPKKEIPFFRRTMGVVFQDFRLIQTMTVFDNVAFAMRVIGANEREIRKRVPYVLSLVGLASKARNYPAELSGGEQQRVALARSLVNNADMIIADEPTGNVDPEMSYEIVELLNHINASGKTVVMVTHEHDLVRQFNHRTVIIENGSVVYDGPGGDNFTFSSESARNLREINLKDEEALRSSGMAGYYDISADGETADFISSYLSEKGYDARKELSAESTEEAEAEIPSETDGSPKALKFSWNKLAVKMGKGKKAKKGAAEPDKSENDSENHKADSDVSETENDGIYNKNEEHIADAAISGDEGDSDSLTGDSEAENAADAGSISACLEEQEESSDNADEQKEDVSAQTDNLDEEEKASYRRKAAVREALGQSIKESLLEGYSFYISKTEEEADGGASDGK